MGTTNYPNLHQLEQRVSSPGLWRVFPIAYKRRPLGVGYGYSRFSAPNKQFKTLYLAASFETALREGLIRDRFDGRRYRRIAEHTIRRQACAIISTVENLNLINLTDGAAGNHGIPSHIRHSADYAASQAFTLEVYNEMKHVDGFLFRSRLDDKICMAVFDRAIDKKLKSIQSIGIDRNPLLRPALKEMRIKVFKW